jgi:hypothetical protein
MRTPGPDMFLLGDQRRRPDNGAAGITIALTRMLKRLVERSSRVISGLASGLARLREPAVALPPESDNEDF